MMWNFKHILSGLLVGMCGLAFVACEKTPIEHASGYNMFISFSAVLVDDAQNAPANSPAAGLQRVAPPSAAHAEDLRSLRVVIVSEDMDNNDNPTGNYTVEVNEIFMSAASLQSEDLTFPVRDGRKKTIYLLGNVDEVYTLKNAAGQTVNLGDAELYKPVDGVAPIEECRFTWESAEQPNWIPMTAVYEVSVPGKEHMTLRNGSYYYGISEPLYLIRAVTKFSFSYVNETTAGGAKTYYRLRSWGLSQVADGPSYLLAKVADDWTTSTQPATNYAALNLPYTPYWPRWLADEAKKCSQTGVNPSDYEWMTAYGLPQATHKDGVYTYRNHYSYNIMPSETPAGTPTPLKLTYYLPECKYIPSGSTQKYQLTFRFWEWIDLNHEDYGREVAYTVDLPNCQSLFRNTEVKVKVRISAQAVSLQTTVCPWTKHEIDIPAFE